MEKNMKPLKLLFRTPIILISLYSHGAISQLMIIETTENKKLANQVKEILENKLIIPSEIINIKQRKNCELTEDEASQYDLVICPKKNGELEFPVYKKAILKNSYRSFF